MRKFLVILLALGLVVAFSMPAAAVDLKFSGTYYVKGYLESNHALREKDATSEGEVQNDWYVSRLRVNTVWQVADGLSLTTRFDAQEKIWGASDGSNQADSLSWERAYVTFKTGIGNFYAGYMSGGGFGTVFNDDVGSVPRLKWVGAFGPWIVLALTEKGVEKDGLDDSTETDSDYDKYAVAAIYKWEGGQAGVLWFYLPDKSSKTGTVTDTDGNFDLVRNYVPVYFKANLGPLYMEGEASYFFGTYDYVTPGVADKDLEGISAYLYAKFNMGPAYVGGQFGYVEGNDPNTRDMEQGYYDNADWDPCLILFNYWLAVYQNGLAGMPTSYGADANSWLGLNNGFLYQAFAGFKPMDTLTLHASLTYAKADEKPLNYVDDEYGTEFDISATWKIYDNLEYYIGFGYLFAGDYFKGTDANAKIEDDYLLMHKLTLSF